VLGAVMSAKVNSLLPARWAAAHLPALSPEQLAAVKSATTVGAAPVQKGMSPQVATAIADVTHTTFVSGMTAAFLVASVVAVGGALIALLTKKGDAPAEVHVAVH
jgi:hypothetical protein